MLPSDTGDTDRCDRSTGLAIVLRALDPHGVSRIIPPADTDPSCPPWCTGHLPGPDGGAHRHVVAFLPRADVSVHVALAVGSTGRPLVVIVPPAARPSPEDLTELTALVVRALDIVRAAHDDGDDQAVTNDTGPVGDHVQAVTDTAPEVTL